jgi:hypothetical protein
MVELVTVSEDEAEENGSRRDTDADMRTGWSFP